MGVKDGVLMDIKDWDMLAFEILSCKFVRVLFEVLCELGDIDVEI